VRLPDVEVRLTRIPLLLIRWLVVVLAVLAWLIVVPIVELVALGYRTLARSGIVRRFRQPLVAAATARPHEGPAGRK
jgi:hypothetical protein